MIQGGQLAPGSRLPGQRELALQFQVSRTALRDALNRLAALGFLENRSKSGSFVCTAIPIGGVGDAKQLALANIIEVRKVLESWAVSRIAENRERKGARELARCVETMVANVEFRTKEQFEAYSAADVRFHMTIAKMTGNPVYLHLVQFLVKLIMRSISVSKELLAEDFAAENLLHHKQVAEAIEKGNAPAARKAMAAHFEFVERHLSQTHNQGRTGKNHRPRRRIQSPSPGGRRLRPSLV